MKFSHKNWLQIMFGAVFLFSASVFGFFSWLNSGQAREPSQATQVSLPNNYEKMSACEKQNFLWQQVEGSRYKKLPAFRSFGISEIVKMQRQGVLQKMTKASDVAPAGWVKYLHAVGSVAKVRWESVGVHEFLGVFKGAECGLIRLSLTYDPDKRSLNMKKMGVAPGLALKILRDSIPSANISALPSLQSQGQDYNFFKSPMSNIVPRWNNVGANMVHKVFKAVSKHPERIDVTHFFEHDAFGKKETLATNVLPKQIVFVPNKSFKLSSSDKDVRNDFHSLKQGELLYEVHVPSSIYANFDYTKYDEAAKAEILKRTIHVGNIYLNSEFVSSSFGDSQLFFRHYDFDH